MDIAADVSAVIPVYSRNRFVGRALGSNLAQTYSASEIVIVDDGSTDDLARALVPFEGKVRLVRHETNRGETAARNTGVDAATGGLPRQR